MGTLLGKLLEIKKKVPYLKKNGQGYGFNYASPEYVLETFNKLLNDAGILLTTTIVDVKSESVQVTDKKGTHQEQMFTVNTCMTFHDVESGEKMDVPWAGAGCNGQEQGFGSALTYAERYFLLKFFNVPTGNDDPDAKKRELEKQKSSGSPVSQDDARNNENELVEFQNHFMLNEKQKTFLGDAAQKQKPDMFIRNFLMKYGLQMAAELGCNITGVKDLSGLYQVVDGYDNGGNNG